MKKQAEVLQAGRPAVSLTVSAAFREVCQELLSSRDERGVWVGELSSSALSTATAVTALALADRARGGSAGDNRMIAGGLEWLAAHQNADGGWGDTDRSFSNISTTVLCWAAFGAVPGADLRYALVIAAAERWLSDRAGGVQPARLVPAIVERYGKDRTFSVPILTMCALAGRLGSAPECWRWVLPLPFELAAFPASWYAALRLPVVSYALPALIAIGQVRHCNLPSRNPLVRMVRNCVRLRTLRVLERIQPASGGFLEATPLTSFVVMSLAGSGQVDHPVTDQGVTFLERSVRPDGSWPIDTNLATWLTTLAVNALSARGRKQDLIDASSRTRIRQWLLGQQFNVLHPYTNAPPGGWAWTDLPGGVPDADDTAGALLALRNLGPIDAALRNSAMAGVRWLLNLQNRDGGIPTFCKGWGALPFDRSSPDLTAHAVRAWLAWSDEVPLETQRRINGALERAMIYLGKTQRENGSWIPLWFGNQWEPDEANPVYGTARVLEALSALADADRIPADDMRARRAIGWLISVQSPDGSWGGVQPGPSSIEETSLTLGALMTAETCGLAGHRTAEVRGAIERGLHWLIGRVESGEYKTAAPIGFYFAKLWYYERLYPLIFASSALAEAAPR